MIERVINDYGWLLPHKINAAGGPLAYLRKLERTGDARAQLIADLRDAMARAINAHNASLDLTAGNVVQTAAKKLSRLLDAPDLQYANITGRNAA